MELLPILLLSIVVIAVGLLIVVGTSFTGPKLKQSEMKKRPYECGLEGMDTDTTKIPVKYYLTAILFILFDIEIIFMYPWAITFQESMDEGFGVQIMLGMGFFLSIFIVGLFWEIKSKAFYYNYPGLNMYIR